MAKSVKGKNAYGCHHKPDQEKQGRCHSQKCWFCNVFVGLGMRAHDWGLFAFFQQFDFSDEVPALVPNRSLWNELAVCFPPSECFGGYAYEVCSLLYGKEVVFHRAVSKSWTFKLNVQLCLSLYYDRDDEACQGERSN